MGRGREARILSFKDTDGIKTHLNIEREGGREREKEGRESEHTRELKMHESERMTGI